ncbi:SEC12-like protein 2 [Physcomitrium patens]|uniref:Anaphase-promoting complex subunit 4 WD40 domain-containing protein n=1 Tax=Physcomitrium patens TaxID=3218 RepID=A9T493_PHYPA|nr:SEC12-like protein 2 [Physcomitrium patens]PNR30247.1 hypothetical protein PHYPA_026563 [Physcomitrium patens]|eukprot:XP_024360191.1 SEC12-like protein 2 [Physcomitrella patens]
MSKKGRYLLCSKKYGQPLFAGAWVKGKKKGDGDGDGKEEAEEEGLVLLAGGGGNQRSGVPNSLLLAEYDFESTVLTDALDTFTTADDPPYRMAAHPAGEGVVCSFEKDCRLFEVCRDDASGKVKVGVAEREIQGLQGVGEQNCLVFSPDGTCLAAGGDDGHLRVIEWGTFKVLLDKAEAHKSIKDLDFSLDGSLVASTSDDSACRIWDMSGNCVSSLPSVRGEGIGFVRFSRDGRKPLLYVAVRKYGAGFVSAFDTTTWKLTTSHKLQEDPISAFSISRDGRFLAIGSSEGAISIVDAASLSVCQTLKRAHMIFVTSMDFSPSGRAILSVSADSSARVTPVEPTNSGSRQGSLLLLVIFFLSMLVVVLGRDVLPDWHHDQSLAGVLSGFLARLTSSSKLNVTSHGNS